LKKIILLLLFITSLFADPKVYVGSSVGIVDESFTNGVDAKTSSVVTKIKVGYGVREAYAVEISFDYIKNNSKIFSSDPSTKYDGDKFGFDLNLIKAFDLNYKALPFIKAGFGSGYFKIDREIQDKLYYGSFNLSTGLFIPMSESFDFEVGYEYKSISYEAIDTIAQQVRYESNTNIAYFGFNVRY